MMIGEVLLPFAVEGRRHQQQYKDQLFHVPHGIGN